MAQQRKRCSYDLSFKLKAIESAEKTSKEAAARQFGVDARRIRERCGQKTKLMALKEKPGNSKRKRLDGGGRKAMDEDMEEAVSRIYLAGIFECLVR